MATVYETILALCQQKGISPGKMCNDLGYSRNTMTALKTGRSTTLKLDKAQRIAEYFGVSVDYLLGNTEEKEQPALSKEDELQDEFFAFYGEVKPYLDERDIDDLKIFMKAKAEHKRKMQDDKG